MTAPTLLVVEDDAAIRRGLVDALRFAGYGVIEAADGAAGLDLALGGAPDLVLLDVLLPKLDGTEVLVRLRAARPTLPVILVTAKGAEGDRVEGLRRGADDYVVKPFSAKELLARVEAVLRRSSARPTDVAALDVAGRRVDLERREVVVDGGAPRQLSEKETEILRYLARNPGRAVSRDELLRNVWGLDPRGVETRTVDMHVARLRDKLGDDAERPSVVVTVRGKGYMLARG
jgi:DNA-binding response OmpR family regulator